MSITIEIPDDLFERLKKHAIPFVDTTPISVIERWADHFEGQTATPAPVAPLAIQVTGRKLDPFTPADLMFTRCRGTFGSIAFRKWNDLVRIAHAEAFKKAGSFEALKAVSHAQIRKGDHTGDSGFHYVKAIDISVQGVDANHAWEYALRLAQYVQTPIRAVVEWRHNDKATFPGEVGSLEWLP